MIVGGRRERPRSIRDLLSPELMARLDRLDVLSRKVFAGKLPGERRSKKRGQSVEFDDYRNYVAGDDLRRIDWNVFARLDRFFVKLFREEEDLSLHLVVDASASMDSGAGEGGADSPTKLVLAQRLAMALGYIGLVNNNRVAASIAGVPGRTRGGLVQLAPMRGRRSVERLARFLMDGIEGDDEVTEGAARGAGDLNDALKAVALARTGKGVMVVLSDFLVRGGVTEGLNYLAGAGGGGAGGAGFDTYGVQVLSPGEMDPASVVIDGRRALIGDMRLTDVETAAAAEVTVTGALLKRYRRRLDTFLEGMRRACVARGMTHVLVRSDADLEKLLMEYLRRRGLLG